MSVRARVLAERKNPDILEFWDLPLTWHHTYIYMHANIYPDTHTDWETNGLGNSIVRGDSVVECAY